MNERVWRVAGELEGRRVDVVLRGTLSRSDESGNLWLDGPGGVGVLLGQGDADGPELVDVRLVATKIVPGELYQDDGGALFVGEGGDTVHPYGLPTVIRSAPAGLRHVKVVGA